MSNAYDVAVIGEGVAGLMAARKLAQSGARAATFEAQLFGGLIVNVNELDPAPDADVASGAEYAAGLMQQNAELGVESIQEPVTAIRASGAAFEIVTESATRTARLVVVASGARLKRLGVPGEVEYEGRGVSQCADCDGPMYQGEAAVVVGGGDSALQEALVLAHYCDRVYLVHRREAYRARADLVAKVSANPKIARIGNATVTAISGADMVRGVTLRYGDGREQTLDCAGVFAYIGLEPNSAMLPAEVARDSEGRVRTNEALETSLPGVWAIGAVRAGYGGTLRDAIAEAERVAQAVQQRLS